MRLEVVMIFINVHIAQRVISHTQFPTVACLQMNRTEIVSRHLEK